MHHEEEHHRLKHIADAVAEHEGECQHDGRDGEPNSVYVYPKDEEVEEDEGCVHHEGDQKFKAPHHCARVLQRRCQVFALLVHLDHGVTCVVQCHLAIVVGVKQRKGLGGLAGGQEVFQILPHDVVAREVRLDVPEQVERQPPRLGLAAELLAARGADLVAQSDLEFVFADVLLHLVQLHDHVQLGGCAPWQTHLVGELLRLLQLLPALALALHCCAATVVARRGGSVFATRHVPQQAPLCRTRTGLADGLCTRR
mmetsp:Transcript_13607/g.41137  ORF Transcript_13607/g.41137 Transcript_13607/m.41137 type:complete len:255 (+) Transcript_13607:1284-2048(+)